MYGSPSMLVIAVGVLTATFVATHAEAQKTVALPAPSLDGGTAVEKTLEKRRSVRDFAKTSLTLAEVGQLAWAAQGKTTADGRRTAPSAGALYPIEILVVATRVEGLTAGVYRYAPGTHTLQRVDGGTPAELARAALGQDPVAAAPAVFAIAGVEARTAVKYGARANRYVMIEAGCVAENLALQAVSLGLGTVLVGAFDDARVASVLKLRKGEQPILLVPVGRGR